MEKVLAATSTDEPPSLAVLSAGLPTLAADPAEALRLAHLDARVSGRWADWKWQMASRLRTLKDLGALLGLSTEAVREYGKVIDFFHYSITPYYLSLADLSDPSDPIGLQCVPSPRELHYEVVGDEDPLEEEEDSQVPGLVHRYPDRVLAVITTTCAMYCRHCTRKRKWHEGERPRTKAELQAMADYIKRIPQVREVVVSGGDPLTVNESLLDWFLGELKTIRHLEVVRIGTRVPVVMPMRITEDLARMLSSHRPLWINTQFNHPREVTPEAAMACDRLQMAGIPVSNQSVLLRGINDSAETMTALCHALQRIMVRPYYLFQCDPVLGVEHFRTSVWKGIEIIEGMRGHTSGMAIPTFVVDATGGGGKIPLQPFYLLSARDNEVMLRNYEGMIIKYFNPSPAPQRAERPGARHSAGVPQSSQRFSRRAKKPVVKPSPGDPQCTLL